MASTSVLQVLEHYTAADPLETEHVATIRAMAAKYPDIMKRTCQAGHITGSALVMDIQTRYVLLHYHKNLQRWLQFGGHMDGHETNPAQTALREAFEESGLQDLTFLTSPHQPLDVDVHIIPARGDEPEHLHLDFRYLLGTTLPGELQAEHGESKIFKWFAIHDLLADYNNQIDAGLKRLIEKAQAYQTA